MAFLLGIHLAICNLFRYESLIVTTYLRTWPGKDGIPAWDPLGIMQLVWGFILKGMSFSCRIDL